MSSYYLKRSKILQKSHLIQNQFFLKKKKADQTDEIKGKGVP